MEKSLLEKYMHKVDEAYVKERLPRRPWDAHKGDFGKVLLVVGSSGMAGAAQLCARGVLRSGAGLARFCVPTGLYNILQTAVPEATCLDRASFRYQADSEPEKFAERLAEYAAIVIGPGLGDATEDAGLIISIIQNYKGTIVIDADGLNLISKLVWPKPGEVNQHMLSLIRKAPGEVILTPHKGEMQRLLNQAPDAVPDVKGLGREQQITEYAEYAKALYKKYSATVVMKHASTVVASEEGLSFNTTGNSGMATGGSGDVLAGIIAGLAAQGMNANEACRCGVYIHGLAGDLAAADLSSRSMLASDLVNYLGAVFKKLEE